MKTECLKCGDEFDGDLAEASDFIQRRADLTYLRQMRFSKELFGHFDSRDMAVFVYVLAHCPYCREVELSKHAFSPNLPNDSLTDEQYLKALEKIIMSKGGFQIRKYDRDEQV